MTIDQFMAKWKRAELKERAAAQEHFLDLCHLLDHPTPAEVDAIGATFCFEKGATKHGGGDGFADVWKRGFFGVLHSRPHEVWSLAQGTQLREKASGFRYTPTTCFETFPFPRPMPVQDDAIAEAARALDAARWNWLGDRSDKKRTLTALYNEKPSWLRDVHRRLDVAVFHAYCWDPGMDDEQLLEELLKLNLARAGNLPTPTP